LSRENKILFIAGEISGDLHGAALIHELKKMNNNISFYGMGGDKMISEGMHITEHINNMAFLGFAEVVKHLPQIRRVKRNIIDIVKKENIRTAVLIDYPGFNLNIAKRLKELGVKIIYYITPQVWAWGKGRVKVMKELVDKVLVILPFEKEFFDKNGIESEFTGHPLLDRISDYPFISKDKFIEEQKLDKRKEILLILPGSRNQEVKTIFPESIKAADKISREYNMQIVVACSGNIDEEVFSSYKEKFSFFVIKGKTYELFKYAAAGIIKSGTSTLEAALFELPMVIVYRTNPLTYMIGKNLVNLKHIGLVNIIYGDNVVPELIQNNLTADNIYAELKKYLSDKSYSDNVKTKLRKVKSMLGEKGASIKAASLITNMLKNAQEA
jgi:lipid-A-disaccharide synthase